MSQHDLSMQGVASVKGLKPFYHLWVQCKLLNLRQTIKITNIEQRASLLHKMD